MKQNQNNQNIELLFIFKIIESDLINQIESSFFNYESNKKFFKLIQISCLELDSSLESLLITNQNQDILKDSLIRIFYSKKEEYQEKKDEFWFNQSFQVWYTRNSVNQKVMTYIERCRRGNDFGNLALELGVEFPDEDKEVDLENDLQKSPTFPEELFKTLPSFLEETCSKFEEGRERDCFLLSQLVAVSSTLDQFKSVYHHDEVFPNLYSFVVAPAASGKRSLKYGVNTLSKIKKTIYQDSKEVFDSWVKDGKVGSEPTLKKFIIPANCSHAAFQKILNDNEGIGFVFESEADVMVDSSNKDWGNYSTDIRQAFQHEVISSARKGNNEHIEIESPKISILLTGTIKQFKNLIKSPEDGLFSRFLYYAFETDTVWKSPRSAHNKTDLFKNNYASWMYDFWSYYQDRFIRFELTEEQWDRFDEKMSSYLDFYIIFNDKEIDSAIKRMGLNCFRMMMIFTAIRNYEKRGLFNDDIENVIYCEEVDFENSFTIIDTLLKHTSLLFSSFPKQEIEIVKDSKEEMFDKLPDIFTTAQFNKLGKEYEISNRSISRFLTTMVKKKLVTRIKKGTYQKK